MRNSLRFLAGKAAYESIKDGGLQPDKVRVMGGAAGGPRWIVLSHIDKMIFGEWFKDRKKPLHLIGSSAGAWRFAAAMSHPDPVEGCNRYKEGYFSQWYSKNPTPKEITEAIPDVIEGFINETTLPHIVNHPYGRLQLIAIRAKGLLASENKWIQAMGLLGAFVSNGIHPPSLNWSLDRVSFEDPRDLVDLYDYNLFPTIRVPLTLENVEQALLSTASIPVLMEGVSHIEGAPKGMYRDGGLTDYHRALPYQLAEEEIVFQPHFFASMKPSWFDRPFSGREPSSKETKHLLMVCPSAEFIQGLPGGKVPDRHDFEKLPNDERIQRWEKAYVQSIRLGEDLMESIESGKIRDQVELWT